MSFHQCTEIFVQLNVLCFDNWLHAPLRKKCGEVLVFSIFHPTRLFRPTQLLIWMNFPPYTIIPHCTAIRHFTVATTLTVVSLLEFNLNPIFGKNSSEHQRLSLRFVWSRVCAFLYSLGPRSFILLLSSLFTPAILLGPVALTYL